MSEPILVTGKEAEELAKRVEKTIAEARKRILDSGAKTCEGVVVSAAGTFKGMQDGD